MSTDEGTSWVLGADVCRGSWAGIMWDGITIKGLFASTITELVEAAHAVGDVAVVAIDIPIGLPEAKPRPADEAARAFVGPRRSSVFPTPIREALHAADYQEARTVSLKLTQKSLSAQAYALRTKILEVEAWLTTTSVRAVETHPEVCFKAMQMDGAPTGDDGTNDHYVPWPKSVWVGQQLRLDLLAHQGLDLTSADLGELAHRSPPDDIIDAAACAWTARRVLLGQQAWLPADPGPGPSGRAIGRITY
jgi:predicted RNase H-like nuclease